MRKILFLVAAAAALFACGPKKTAQTPSAEAFAPYIKAYTGGIVAPDAQIRIELMEAAASQPTEGLFAFTPTVQGHVKWNSATSVTFVPDTLLPGKQYAVRFFLGKVQEGAPESFDFGLAVRAPEVQEAESVVQAQPGEGFRVLRATLAGDHIDVELSDAPVNALQKGLVELQGAVRSYVQVQDKRLCVYFEGRSEDLTLTLDKGIKNAAGEALGQDAVFTFTLNEDKPAVEIPLQGCILPDKDRLILPFRAVNLSAVEVRVVKIYEKNVLMFLQDNDLGGNSALRRSGRLVYRGDIPLDASKDLHRWNSHSIDLSGLLKQEPGAIYRIRLSFRLDQSLYGGKEPMLNPAAPSGKPTEEDEAQWDQPSPYYWDNDYDWDAYDWNEADDPTKASYYMDSDRFPSVQLLSSDLGLVAEYAGGQQIWVATTDILSAQPVSGASVEVYDFQLQQIGSGKTDGKGLVTIPVQRQPFAVVAKAGGSVAYLKVNAGNERSLSRFDVGGQVLQKGLKGFVYGERGVWRPGDTMHLTLLLDDKGKSLPEGHPATLEVYTPEGQFYSRLVRQGTDGFYSFDVPTKADDPTGYWNAYFKVGGSTFHKILHIETVKPNRLKITTSYPSVLEAGKTITVRTQADWLSGGAAQFAPVEARMTLRRMKDSPFKGFEKYSFNDPSSNFSSAEHPLFKGKLDGNGQGSVSVPLPEAAYAPGMLQAFVVTSVSEPGGDESFTTETLPYSPYSAYVGIRVPDGDYLETDKDQTIGLAVVDANGKRVKGHKVEYAVFKTGWNWWWESPGQGELDAYVSGPSVRKICSGILTSGTQDVNFILRENYPEWGRYLILARDVNSGHVSGRVVTVDWPEYRGRADRRDPESLTMLSFSTDKPAYKAGEKATVYIPAAPGGKALVSLENGAGVLAREWVSTGNQDTPWTFTVEPGMAPNIYVHITLLQPYGNTVNDLPLRLYGVQRVKVENPASHLEPVLEMPATLHPEEPFEVKVKEKSGRPMTYTLAIVDEGLLDITAFKTPDPWSQMYQTEALGVKTWDLFDQVIGAFSGKFSPLAAIGGDEDAIRNARKDNRFNPVVLFQAPRTLEKGTDVLKLELPQYVGSVRVMLIAGHEGAYGNAVKTVPVQNPLMVVTTLPRVLGCGESISVPVNVFAMEDGVQEATVTIKADGPVKLSGPATQTVRFNGKGDQLVHFALQATDGEGTAHVSVQASGGGHKASEDIALPVRNAQPEITQVERFTLQPGQSRALNGGTLQLAGFPALDARQLYLTMRDYPYDCAEQLSARGLTLLELLPLLPEADAARAKELIPELIGRLYARQGADGGFSYWGGGPSGTWVSSMAGHFLTLAQKDGFEVNAGVLKAWKGFQQKQSLLYRSVEGNEYLQMDEAYRLYTLAAAGSANQAGMNRLRESNKLGQNARYMLSAAYAMAGKGQTAGTLLDGVGREFPEYTPYNLTYGTALRDRMVALDALVLNGRVADALALAGESLSAGHLSTQESAFTAVAYRHLYDKLPTAGIKAEVNGKEVGSAGSMLSVPATGSVKNTAEGALYCTLLTVSREPLSKAVSNGLKLEVKYTDENGALLLPGSYPIQQGMRIHATVKVTSTLPRDLENLALSLPVPSGWEIVNQRLTGETSQEGYDHLDIRDDRANWFFALPAGRYKTFTLQMRAAYEGSYFWPSVVCEAMYEPAVNAATASGQTTVTR